MLPSIKGFRSVRLPATVQRTARVKILAAPRGLLPGFSFSGGSSLLFRPALFECVLFATQLRLNILLVLRIGSFVSTIDPSCHCCDSAAVDDSDMRKEWQGAGMDAALAQNIAYWGKQ